MSLSNLVRKAKKGIAVGLVSTAIYAGSIGLTESAYSQEMTSPLKKSEAVATMSEKLTQQGDDFYKDAVKEYNAYQRTYITLARDGRIDSKDVAELEKILGQTVKEIDAKLLDNNGKLKKPAIVESMVKFLRAYESMNSDLKLFQKHLRLKEEWLSGYAAKGDFWNYGTGLGFYGGRTNNGAADRNVDENELGIDDVINSPEDEFRKSIYVNPTNHKIEVLKLSDEFPTQTKFNYWLGLLGGAIIPQLLGASSLIRRHKRGKKIDEDAVGATMAGRFFLNSLPGFIILDSLHPLVYPVRLGLPAIYEAGQWLFGRRDYSKDNPTEEKSSEEEKKSIKEKPKEKSQEVPDLPTDFIDPWSIDIRGKEGGK